MQIKNNRQRGKIILVALFLSLLPATCLAKNFSAEAASIKNPQALVNWLASNFSYVMEMPDKWQTPEETVQLKTGDCEDFAILASAILTRLGIANDIIIVKYKGLNIAHAICAWKDKDGFYKYISNQEMVNTRKGNLEEAIEKFHPDWENIVFTNPKGEYKKIVTRSKHRNAVPARLEAASK